MGGLRSILLSAASDLVVLSDFCSTLLEIRNEDLDEFKIKKPILHNAANNSRIC